MNDTAGEFSLIILFLELNRSIPVTALVVAGVLLLLLIILSGLLSGAEIAYFSFNNAKVNAIEGTIGDKIRWLWNRPEKLLATILIYNNLVNISIILLSAWFFSTLFHYPALWVEFFVNVVLITCIIVLFCEMLPKILANIKPVAVARFMASPLQMGMVLMFPVIMIMVKSTHFIDRRIRRKNIDISREDLSQAISYSAKIANTDAGEAKLLKGIIDFGDKEVTEAMTSRIDVVAIDADLHFSDILKLIKESGYSRYPVFREGIDNIIGVLHIKNLLPYISSDSYEHWQEKIRPVHFIPENKRINDLLKEFQMKKMHMAAVVDEFGGFSGIITLEDIIEEIVGDISDEFDEESDNTYYRKLKENQFEFEGKVLIHDFIKVLELSDDFTSMAKGDADTLAGFLLEIKGDIPQTGEQLNYQSLHFTIKEADHRRIKKIVVEINKRVNEE